MSMNDNIFIKVDEESPLVFEDSPLLLLHDFLLVHILTHLTAKENIKVSTVCNRFRVVSVGSVLLVWLVLY